MELQDQPNLRVSDPAEAKSAIIKFNLNDEPERKDGVDDEQTDESTGKAKSTRLDAQFHTFIRNMTETSLFNVFIMTAIVLNAFAMALETDISLSELVGPDFFSVLDQIFLAIYTVEFIMKIYAEPKEYWRSFYNLFDFFVLVMSYVQEFMVIIDPTGQQNFGGLRILRALRSLRTLKTISFIRGLQVLVVALMDTIRKSVLNIVSLLLLMMLLFAIMGYYLFTYDIEINSEQDQINADLVYENWGNLGAAMLTLFTLVTVEGWTKLQARLDAYGFEYSRLYTVLFIVIGHFIFTNVFIGVIIMNISDATENFKKSQMNERQAALQNKKDFTLQRQHKYVSQMMERQKHGKYLNFQEMVKEFGLALSHDDYVMMADLCNNLLWMEMFMTSLDHMDNTMYRCQQLHFEIAHVLSSAMENKYRQRYGTADIEK
ncbi:cation channel sperm-associated protein 3-like [Lineus longissimus]|uniref:cation channel sperm-associated protein 3-like n=1 Tax=Lineus longissimus TaxID=88925 RepID=UPI00315DA9A2